MPTYDYQCKKCNHVFEKLLKIAEMDVPEKEKCPSCNKKGVKRFLGGCPPTVDPMRLGRVKLNGDFKNMMQGMNKFYRGHSKIQAH